MNWEEDKEIVKRKLKSAWNYARTFVRWLLIAGTTGAVGGLAGGLFHKAVDMATQVRTGNPWLVYFLPLAGLLIVFLYHLFKLDQDPGTNRVLVSVRSEKEVPAAMGPLIFVSTVLTHLFGGSAGREGAALQLGGSIGAVLGKALHLDEKDRHIMIMCGMAGVFSALFGTPITAMVFAMEVVSVGVMYYSGMFPCLASAYMAWWISSRLGNQATAFSLTGIPVITFGSSLRVMGLAASCALVSILFCALMKYGHRWMAKAVPNPYLRAAAGGAAIILLTLLAGNGDYNGAGMDVIIKAVEGGKIFVFAFLLKIIFTAITIGSGYKGGEIVPTFFIGAAFGSVMGGFLGLSGGFGAGVGIIAMFCGVVNCPMASIMLSMELFDGAGFVYFVMAVSVSYMLSGYYGLYSEQKILYSKLRAEFININAK